MSLYCFPNNIQYGKFQSTKSFLVILVDLMATFGSVKESNSLSFYWHHLCRL